MPWQVSADPERFEEAIQWLMQRTVLSSEEAARTDLDTLQRSFYVGGGLQLAQVQRVFDEIAKSLEDGEPFEEFRKRVRSTLKNPAHAETVFRNATQRSYNAGRYRQMKEPSVARFRPYWLYDSILDTRTSETCKTRNGTLLPQDHQWWNGNIPPLHHRCFPAGTLVVTDSGQRAIETIKVGDRVLTHQGRYRAVLAILKSPSPDRLVQIRCVSGAHCVGTETHPALTQRGWVEFSALHPGDYLLHLREATTQNGTVRNRDRQVAAGVEFTGAREREALAHLADLDDQIEVRQVEVDEERSLVGDDRELELVADAPLFQPPHEGDFGRRGFGSSLRVRPGISTKLSQASGDTLGDCARGDAAAGLNKLSGDRCQAPISLLGQALGPVLPALGSSEQAADVILPVGVARPLIGDSLAATPHRHPVLLEQSTRDLDAVTAELLHGLAQRKLAGDVEFSQDFWQSLTVLLQQSVFECRLEVVAGHEYLDATGASVFNIEVEEDESYVASGFVVHNCRSSLRNLRKSEAEKRGITTVPPVTPTHEGWGNAPDNAPIWKPDPKKHDPKLLAELEKKKAAADKKPAPKKPKGKPEHSPKHWLDEYKHLGEAAAPAAYGRAMLERGLDRTPTEIIAEVERLKNAGHPAFRSISAPELYKLPKNRPVRNTVTGQHYRDLIAFTEHTRSIKPHTDFAAGHGGTALGTRVVNEAERFYRLSLAASLANPKDDYHVDLVPGRAYHSVMKLRSDGSAGPRIAIDPKNPTSIAVHELGHALEAQNERVRARSRAFLLARTKGETLKKLKDLFPDHDYKEHEVAWEDEFFHAYVGSDYGNRNSEVLSMGYQRLVESLAIGFSRGTHRRQDEEYLFFLLGQLAGE